MSKSTNEVIPGPKKQRTIETGVGPVEVRQPRVNDRRVDENGERFRFTSKILPPYLRRTKSIDELIPWLYLKGISTGDFSECLRHLVGTDTAGLSPTTVVRLKETWIKEQQEWSRRSLEGKLVQSAAKRWRRLTGHALIADVIQGVQFNDGIKENVA